jgi:hypothetical protein
VVSELIGVCRHSWLVASIVRAGESPGEFAHERMPSACAVLSMRTSSLPDTRPRRPVPGHYDRMKRCGCHCLVVVRDEVAAEQLDRSGVSQPVRKCRAVVIRLRGPQPVPMSRDDHEQAVEALVIMIGDRWWAQRDRAIAADLDVSGHDDGDEPGSPGHAIAHIGCLPRR